MPNAAALIDSYNTIAQDWAIAQSVAKATLRAAQSGAVYRRTWPSFEALETLMEVDCDPTLRGSGWLDSTLDLRDGLSVVEVFTASADTEAALAGAGIPAFDF